MIELQKFVDEHRDWAVKTFGATPVTAPVKHLHKEVKELLDALEENEFNAVEEEFADCFILLLHAADKSGFTVQHLIEAARRKFEINKLRIWPAVDADGVSHHIK